MIISHEQTFSPVVILTAFETEEQAIEKANNSIHVLRCSIFLQNTERAHGLARKLRSGTV
ncbi:hypothetical protein BO79DRAFT_143257 [Aspergillus costaricaensis CBS 115574]|uniref:Uncharacterized protein n=1 Tax=Aspergillus costaricaensis CBS 115574 TaxID=1448317 RepID=A0ACD1IJH1_9EURO|nr:hypothetical protein BO79DRAFT_143257 [Aspergillus costaricaensis CBS 115574]RAK90431.1 hypothetical protein BO79DRAFT_143257 [Aspergillus costaricaensis CBS 115574]